MIRILIGAMFFFLSLGQAGAAGAVKVDTRVMTGSPDLRIEYPEISLPDARLAAQVNAQIKALVRRERDEYLKAFKESGGGLSGGAGEGWYLSISFDAGVVSNEMVSFSFAAESYEGGAHGDHYFFTYNAALMGGVLRPIKLSGGALFRASSDPKASFSTLCMTDLNRQGAEWIVDGTVGTSDLSKELDTFYFTKEGITFLFGDYAVGPYVAGDYSVSLPYRDFREIVEPSGPLGAFLP